MHDDGVANCHLCHSRLCWDTVVAKTHCESWQQYLNQQGDAVNPNSNTNSGDDENEEWCGDVFATYWVKHQALSSHPERVKHYQLSQGSFWSGHIPLITLIKCHKGHTPIGILCICVFNNGYSLTLIPLSHIVTTSIVHILHFLDAIDISYFCPRLSARFWPQALFAFWPILMGRRGGDICESSPQARPLGYWNWTRWILNADSEICITPYFHIFSYLPEQQDQSKCDANFKIPNTNACNLSVTFIKMRLSQWFLFSFLYCWIFVFL